MVISVEAGSEIEFFHWKDEKEFLTKGSGFPAIVFARSLLPELFPQYDRVIYLDSDMLVERDIGELYDMPLEGRGIGAVPEELWKDVFQKDGFFDPEKKISYREYYENLGITPDHPYCSSGLLLMDMALLRQLEIGKIVRQHSKDKLRFSDQDLLNAYLKDTILPFDRCWNNLSYTPDPEDKQIIHYLQKTWKSSFGSAYFACYWQFMRQPPVFYRARAELILYEIEAYVNSIWRRPGDSSFKALFQLMYHLVAAVFRRMKKIRRNS